jgi:peroxiredoxin
MLTPNQPAPDFTTVDSTGAPFRLSDIRGKKILLSFFRNGACALCNLRVHALIQRYESYQAHGMEIVAVFESHLQDMTNEVGRQNAPFPILADPDGSIHELFEVENSMEKVQATMQHPDVQSVIASAAAIGFPLKQQEEANFARIPADFLLDVNLVVHTAHYGSMVFDHLPFETIERFAGM